MADDDAKWITLKIPVRLADPHDQVQRDAAVAEVHRQVVAQLAERGRKLAADYTMKVRGGDGLAPDQVMMVVACRHIPADAERVGGDTTAVTVDTGGCCHCGTTERSLRPYGPGGAPVCQPCATLPEHIEQTKAAFAAQLDAAQAMSPDGVAVLSAERPPEPLADGDLDGHHRVD